MSSDPSRRRVLHALGVGGVFALGANDGSKAHTLSGPGVPVARVGDVVYADDDAARVRRRR